MDYTIEKAELTVTANSEEITYGDDFKGFRVAYSGFVNGDDVSCLSGELTFTSGYPQAENSYGKVGTYKIKPGGLSSDNYEIAYISGTLTVNPKAITVTADSAEKTYGDADPEFTYEALGLVGEDELKGTLSREEGEAVGVYKITGGDLIGKRNPDYIISFTDADFIIRTKIIEAPEIVLSYNETVYDGGEKEPGATVKVNGTAIPETEYSVSYSDNVNAGDAVVTIGDNEGGNYVVSGETTFRIKPASITVTADAKTKVYGSPDPVLTYKATGLIGSDSLSGELSRESGENVGEYNIGKGTLTAGDNYEIVNVNGTLKVTKAETNTVTVDISGWTYGDNANVTVLVSALVTFSVPFTFTIS